MADIAAVSSGAISADAVYLATSNSILLGLIFGLVLAVAVVFYLMGGAKL